MQFGLFYEAPEDPRQTHAERFAEMLDLIVYGESLGCDIAWLAESHCGRLPIEEVKRTMAQCADAVMPKV
jgi:hypothetical protein